MSNIFDIDMDTAPGFLVFGICTFIVSGTLTDPPRFHVILGEWGDWGTRDGGDYGQANSDADGIACPFACRLVIEATNINTAPATARLYALAPQAWCR